MTPKAKGMREELTRLRKAVNEELTGALSLEERLLLKRMLKDVKA